MSSRGGAVGAGHDPVDHGDAGIRRTQTEAAQDGIRRRFTTIRSWQLDGQPLIERGTRGGPAIMGYKVSTYSAAVERRAARASRRHPLYLTVAGAPALAGVEDLDAQLLGAAIAAPSE